MESLLFMILRGIVIGVVVSAPMGPVGIFILQRTLDKGRLSGLYTGIGAAISDIIYCLLTGFGLSFIEEFINAHRSPIQFLGSLVLVGFGIWLIHKKPDGSIAKEADAGSLSPESDILKGFALTFSNPLILFLIIGLFAQFNFVIEGIRFYHYILGFIGIAAGALGWWWLVTFFVDKLRGHFKQKTMKLINTVIGIIILIFAAVGIITSSSSMMVASEVSSPLSQIVPGSSVSFRVADTSMKGWTVRLSDSSGHGFRLEIGPSKKSDPFGDSHSDVLLVRAYGEPGGEELGTALVTEGVDPYRGPNSWRMVAGDSGWLVFAGNRELRHLMSVACKLSAPVDVEVKESAGGAIVLSVFDIDMPAPPSIAIATAEDMELLQNSSFKKTEIAGVYSLFDYEQDDSYARLGGAYRIGVMPASNEGELEIIYIGGARENAGLWTPGMVKGRLRKSPFAGIYDVEWVDAERNVMKADVTGEFDPLSSALTVRFPYQGCVMRFRKE